MQPAKSGEVAIKPGDPLGSEAIKRILSTDEDELMPPKEAHKTLTEPQKKMLRDWIAQGADYQPHWSYIAPVKVPVPRVTDGVLRNPIDAFVQSALEGRGVGPSAEAPRAALLRRLSLDLTGLPPTVEEVRAFESDPSADAYEKQVERLLASSHYGERMASQWLDVARYADTVGFHGDQNMNVWAYRDWVIASFNRNQPFDQFTIEQLAGDLLPNPTPAQMAATCFNRLNMVTREGGAQPKEYLTKYTADRVRTVGTAWLGSTFGCAECHDHKFDPISTKDFYSLGAFFADIKQWGVYSNYGYSPEPELDGFTNDFPFPPEMQIESPALLRKMEALEERLRDLGQKAAISSPKMDEWRNEAGVFLQQHPDALLPLSAISVKRLGASKGAPKQDAKESNEKRAKRTPGKLEVELGTKPGWVASVLLDILPNAEISGDRPPEWLVVAEPDAAPGKITLSGKDTKVKVAFRLMRKGKASPLKVWHATANRKKPDYRNGEEILGVQNVWKTKDADQPHRAVYLLEQPIRMEEGDRLLVEVETGDGKVADSELVRFGVSVSPLVPARPDEAFLPTKLAEGESASGLEYLRSTGADASLHAELKTVFQEWMSCHRGTTPVLVTQSSPSPLTSRVLPRGNWMDESGEVVLPETPHFLPQPANSAPVKTRLDLARWLVSEQNPLTARVVMNRMWRQFFGNALSLQSDELGSQGDPPSHPELLDWLAVEFREKGWDVKSMVRLMVHSHTYRQSSQLRAELLEADPSNRWLASQNPRRLEAEAVRDNALAIAGLLNREMGGPPAKPYQPAGYYQALQFPNREYEASRGGEQYRRSVYSHWQRTFLHPMLANFDAPSREDCIALRSSANTPQQALTLLNDPSFVEAARVWATRLLVQGDLSGEEARLARAGWEALGRPWSAEEERGLKSLLAKLRQEYAARREDAGSLVKVGFARVPETVAPVELAVWTNLCRVVLNLHETITRY